MMDQIISRLKNNRRVLLATHVNPDGDAIGSLLAMGLALEELKINAKLFCQSPIPALYRFLPWSHRVCRTIGNTQDYDTAIILDCGDLERIGDASKIVRQIPVIINIDHHLTNTYFGRFNHVDIKACATAEIIYYLIHKMGINISQPIARCLYTGILTDTGSFRFSNTNRAAFEICQKLVDSGVDPHDVAKHVYGQYSLARIKLLNLALDSLEISKNKKLSLMTLTHKMLKETETQNEDIDGMINYARRIKNIKIAVLIQEYQNGQPPTGEKGRYHVSLRSDGSVDVAKIAMDFGGGGHMTAAGFCTESQLPYLKKVILKLAEVL
ncbi:MAG: bifunctional oligoribonuclease/PAP phosphatase NrnA [Desulfobacterales bacterium]